MSTSRAKRDAESFGEIARSLKPHPSKVQILIEATSKGATLQKALAILRASEIHQIEYQILRKGDPSWILLQFPNNNFQEAILNLTEAGFVKLEGKSPIAKQGEDGKQDI